MKKIKLNLMTFALPIRQSINLCLIFTLLFSQSCSDFLEIAPPRTEQVTETVFSTAATANAAITSIYSQMENEKNLPYYISLYTGLYSDELKNYSSIPDLLQFYTNSINPQNGYLYSDLWQSFYTYIYQANAAITAINNSNTLPNELRTQLKGESLFIRAFCNFYLVNFFSDIPLVLTTDYKLNSNISRSPSDTIYYQIKKDLLEAIDLLNSDYVGMDGTSIITDRVRPNKWSAAALLARVYLYTKEYKSAELQATNVIQQTRYYNLENDINLVFLKNSSETIWALQPYADYGFNTPEGNKFILNGPPSNATTGNCTAISRGLLEAFENGDTRRSSWIGQYDTLKFPFKYKIQNESVLKEYSVVFRLSEMYLIRAESHLYQGKLQEAVSDLNTIRRRANLEDKNISNREIILNWITHERQVELFCEWGHRLLDIKRLNIANTIMPGASIRKGGSWTDYKINLPVPQIERLNNPTLSQNTGY